MNRANVSLRSETSFDILLSMKYWTGAHTKHRHMYHIVWIPKYRRRILEGKFAVRIEELLRQCAEVNRWEIHELNVQPNHVHMLVQLRPNISVSYAVQMFKGGSSKVLKEEFPELEEYLWGDSFWAEGYFSETIGQINEAVMREYIKNQ
jgi:putative transposase